MFQSNFLLESSYRKTHHHNQFAFIPEETTEAYFENNPKIETANKTSETTDIQNGVALINVLSVWKGLVYSLKSDFWWTTYKNHRRLRQDVSYWTLAGMLVLILVTGTGSFSHETPKHRKVLQMEL
jgi:hypothetical protein